MFEGVYWALGHNPGIGHPIDTYGQFLWALPLKAWLPKGIPDLVLYYHFDAKNVTIVDFRVRTD